jgi:cytochrome c biogenesis factor
VIAAVCILLGTLFPLFMDALGLGKYSVGPPYFNKVFLPVMIPLAMVAGIGAMLRFKRDHSPPRPPTVGALAVSIVAGFSCSLDAIRTLVPWRGPGHGSRLLGHHQQPAGAV